MKKSLLGLLFLCGCSPTSEPKKEVSMLNVETSKGNSPAKLLRASVGQNISCGYPGIEAMQKLAHALEKEGFTIIRISKVAVSVEVEEAIFEKVFKVKSNIGYQKINPDGIQIGDDGRYTEISKANWVEIVSTPLLLTEEQEVKNAVRSWSVTDSTEMEREASMSAKLVRASIGFNLDQVPDNKELELLSKELEKVGFKILHVGSRAISVEVDEKIFETTLMAKPVVGFQKIKTSGVQINDEGYYYCEPISKIGFVEIAPTPVFFNRK